MYLEKINKPKDLNELKIEELNALSNELREALMFKLSKRGGHNGPNLGMVELSIALHYVFNSPIDKIVFDVSHQSYIHKMLTGRWKSFKDEDKFDLITGYTDPTESEHDFFTIGHTSTSISLAYGLAKARDLKGDKENIIAVIGDGSLSGGEALEGLNNAGELNSNLIIIVNDNNQSIAENHGGFYRNLKELREGKGKASTNLFTAMGLDYKYVDTGHDLSVLIDELSEVKDREKPIVVHVKTTKGKGFTPAEENREKFHAGGPIDIEAGDYKFIDSSENYVTKTRDILVDEMKKDQTVATITAGTPSVLGFTKELRDEFNKQFIDVGIAEEHAVAMSSAMAKNGAKPVFGVVSTFLQRTYDQLSHDMSIDSNSATILVYYGSAYGMNDVTHLGLYDIAMISNIPNLVYLSPTNMEEHEAMLRYAIHQDKQPIAIRVPVGPLVETGIKDETDYSVVNKFEVVNKGNKVALIGAGNFFNIAKEVQEELKKNYGMEVTLINPKFISGVDKELLKELEKNHDLVITLEDGQIEGGFGSKVANFYVDSDIRVKTLGYRKEFIDKYNPDEFVKANGITVEQIIDLIKEV